MFVWEVIKNIGMYPVNHVENRVVIFLLIKKHQDPMKLVYYLIFNIDHIMYYHYDMNNIVTIKGPECLHF